MKQLSRAGEYADWAQLELEREPGPRVSLFVIFFLVPLIISSITVAPLPVMNYVVVGFGVVCSIAYLIGTLQGRLIFPKEILLFVFFTAWSLLGWLNVAVPFFFRQALFSLFKFLAMIFIIAYYSNNVAAARVLLVAVLIACAVVGASAYVSGEYQQAEIERVAGLALNANSFALTLIYGAAILLYFTRTSKSWILKASVVVLLLLVGRLIIASGSRKGFLGFLLLLFSWFAFSYRREIFRRPLVTLVVLLMFLGVSAFFYRSLSGTILEERMMEMTEAARGGRDSSIEVRITMLEEALIFVKSHPIVGIGLDQFRAHSLLGKYSHNNYMELLSCTGVVGGMLYYFIFVVLWLRLRRLTKLPLHTKERELVNLSKTFLVFRLVMDLGVVSYNLKRNWIMLAIIIGWSYQYEKQLRAEASTENAVPEAQHDVYGAYPLSEGLHT